jgi:uncharacterized protein YydD (DUF2326 family)
MKKNKKLSYWFILVIFILITIGTSVWDSMKDKEQTDLERENYIQICQEIRQNVEESMSDYTLNEEEIESMNQKIEEGIAECISESEKSLQFKKDVNSLQEPLLDIPTLITNLLISIFLFFILRALLSINADLV